MRYNTIRQIVQEFDKISILLKEYPDTEKLLKQHSNEMENLKLWRNEFSANKNSIYVVGKTSTGKSEFHNFLLDIKDPKLRLFKTSTKVETSVLQTIQHCESLEQAYAEVYIKNLHEWDKLKNHFNNFGIQLVDPDSIKLKLTSVEEVSFLRDIIMAKSDQDQDFKISEAAHSIHIFFPLKYFKNHKFIDTPGLASHESGTDDSVRNEFQGKSHVLWFLDASQRSLSSSLTLLAIEKELLKKNVERTIFVANRFDLLDNDEGDKNFYMVMAEELRETFKKEVNNILEHVEMPLDLIFTSFKKPNKKFGNQTTIDVIKSLENDILMSRKHITFNNIETYVKTLNSILVKLKINIEEKKKGILKKDLIKAVNNIKRSSQGKLAIEKDISSTVPHIIHSAIKEIENIKKEKNLNTHKRYNNYIATFIRTINSTYSKIINITRARLPNHSIQLTAELEDYKRIKHLSLNQKEGFFEKYLYDEELDDKKKYLTQYVKSKTQKLKQIELELIKEFTEFQKKHLDHLNSHQGIATDLTQKISNLDYLIDLLDMVIHKINKLNDLLLEEVEADVSNWKAINIEEGIDKKIENFLQLHYLLDEHEILIQRNKKI